MAWTSRMRATSFGVTMLVSLAEYVFFGVPIGLILWLIKVPSGGRIVSLGLELAIPYALAIAVGTHFWPLEPLVRTRAGRGEA